MAFHNKIKTSRHKSDTIIDMNGYIIHITDLQVAIKQADTFRYNYHVDSSFKLLDQHLQAYWQDFYRKLVALQSGK